MTPTEHYREAERIIAALREREAEINRLRSAGTFGKADADAYFEQRRASLAAAQVHATLAAAHGVPGAWRDAGDAIANQYAPTGPSS